MSSAPRVDVTSAGKLVSRLTLDEKAGLTSGKDFWHTKGAGEIPSVMVTDGPHGLRKQRAGGDHLGLEDSVPATCFPPAVALGATFDVTLVERVGQALGVESAIEDVAVLLGPGVNIKRSPLCGRNFEYFSEDPALSGEIGAAWVKGVQSEGVGTSLKHFAANNQETDRLRVSSDVDERTLREIYLRGFQRVVEDAQPWTVMCAYNKINGVYASQDPWLLTSVLRDEWGFEGLVVSDWGAVSDRVAALVAGLDLEMPSSNGRTDAKIVAAVRAGDLDESIVDRAATRVARMALAASARASAPSALDVEKHHALAREVAGRSIVLLKNEGALPLERNLPLAVIGAFAERPRYQGAGSSLINPTRVDIALDFIREISESEVIYSAGYSLDADPDSGENERLCQEAVEAAANADTAVVFLGLPDRLESEGFDRDSLSLPAEQLGLLDEVVKAAKRVVVVLSHGGVVTLPFADSVDAILDASLLGQAGGSAIADVLYGDVNPSAKLTETIPVRLEDSPAFGAFPGEFGHVRYAEGLLVGYRWYDTRDIPVAFPFGHGLSYTSFTYGETSASVRADGDIDVRVTVTNTGDRDGREIVQVYSGLSESVVARPVRELKAFASVPLAVGESREVELRVRRQDLAYWDTRVSGWVVEGGPYSFDIAASSRDVRTSMQVEITGDAVHLPYSADSTLGEVLSDPVAASALRSLLERTGVTSLAASDDESVQMMMASFPIGRMGMFGLSDADLEELITSVNSRA